MGSKVYSSDPDWWRQAVVYQIYPRSFADANGDGIGDLQGIISKVPYLKSLNVDAVWLTPFYPSPLKDGGYDVADYRNVDPNIGTLEDFDEMIAALKAVDIKVMVDIVPNHCSEEHPWFQEALKSPAGSNARARFHFHDGKGPDKKEPPNDWDCLWTGSIWEPVGDGQYYMHMFDTSQPDLNWDHPDVHADFLETLRFWGDRGVGGFRIDVAQALAKDMSEPFITYAEAKERQGWLRKDGKATDYHPYWDREQVFDIYKTWRKVFNSYDPPLTAVGEVLVSHDRVPLYASPEGLGQVFAFDIQKEAYDAAAFKGIIDGLYNTARNAGTTTTWVLSNHDVVRHTTRYASPKCTTVVDDIQTWNDKFSNELLVNKGKDLDAELGLRRARAAMLLILSLPGSAYIYQGEELGLPEVIDIPSDKRQDPIFFRSNGTLVGRDGCRVPIPWDTSAPSCGFSPESATAEPWLPIPDWWSDYSVQAGEKDDQSTLHLYRRALELRKGLQDKSEQMTWVGEQQPGVLHFSRPGGWTVMFNMGAEGEVRIPEGKVLLSSETLQGDVLPKDTAVWVMAA